MTQHPKIRDRDLALPLDIESERWARLSQGIIRMGCVVFALLVLIAGIAPVREVAIANGQLTTPDPPIEVEHFDGGFVETILVRTGELVESGTPLLRLARGRVESELAQTRARHAYQTLQRERLLAHVEQRQPDFGNQPITFAGLVREQSALHSAETATMVAEANATRAEITELEMEQDAAGRETDSLLAQFNHAEAEATLQSQLLERGLATRSRVLNASREMERVRGDIAAAQRTGLAALRSISEVRRRQLARASERLQQWSEQITELSALITELEETERQQLARLQRLVIHSPVQGIVHDLAVRGVGDVLAPGDRVATIVPTSRELIAEVRLDPSDIGFVNTGTPAEITVTTFDREVFGTLDAYVSSISPTTFQLGDAPPYYVVKLSVDSLTLEGASQSGDLLPGMVVHAALRTGEKSILRYMLKPIVRAWDVAFSER